MKNKILIFLIFILTFSLNIFAFNVNSVKAPTILSNEKNIVQSFVYNLNDIEEYEIYTTSSDIIFKDTEENRIKAVFTQKKNKNKKDEIPELYYYIHGKILECFIKWPEINKNVKSNNIGIHAKLEVYIPKNCVRKKYIKTVSGDIDAYIIKSLNIEIETVSGDIDIKEIRSEKIDVTTVSGDIKSESVHCDNIRFQSVSGDFKVKTLSGNIWQNSVSGEFEASILNSNEIECKTVSGDVDIKILNKRNIKIRLNTLSGDMDVNSNINIYKKTKRELRGEYKDNSLKSVVLNIKVKTVSGDIDLQ